ncbi:PIN domain-containing protein [Geotalea toluenoxydans]|uniref:PIN domain-containing protein n=1 Tax=Geotalea toluenoxydans TaxID=421624 RepID=UPI001FB37BEA|nr:PIN domain-containing protein [Geotalea toluenoxydans]
MDRVLPQARALFWRGDAVDRRRTGLLHRIILAELMQGAKSDKELAVLADFPHVFEFLPETPELWAAAGRLSFDLRRKGQTIGLADCFIAAAAAQAGVPLATLDAHFEIVKKAAKISLYPIPGRK